VKFREISWLIFGANVKRIIIIFILTLFLSVAAFARQNSVATDDPAIDPTAFKSDGCTGFPDGNYRDCCVAHDREYYAGGSWKARWRSDKKLFLCVASKPKFYNKLIAPVVWLGVRVGGASWLNTSFSWGFGKRKKPSVKIREQKK
jgi:hypothetical protein